MTSRRRTKRRRPTNDRGRKKKVCQFCREKTEFIDYKDVAVLRKYMSDRGKIRAPAVRMIHEYYGVSMQVAMDWRASGNSLQTIMTGEYHKRHGKPAHAGHKGHRKGKGHKKK